MTLLFKDRRDAGAQLARLLEHHAGRANTLVLALPRGGVPVGFEIAHHLRSPLDVFLVRKLGVPGQEELAFGAIASGGHRVLNDAIVRALNLDEETIEAIAAREERELARREQLYRGAKPPPDVRGKTIILVDDGLATGSSMCVAARALRLAQPARLVIAVPVGAASTVAWMKDEADEVIAKTFPHDFVAVGEWYLDFEQTTDEEVVGLLKMAERIHATG